MASLVPQVVRITTIARPTITNFEARGVTQSGKMGDEPYRAYGLTGKNQICGIADSGINDLSCFFMGERDEIITIIQPFFSSDIIAFHMTHSYVTHLIDR